MVAWRLVSQGRAGSVALVGCGLAALLPSLALAASVSSSHHAAGAPTSKSIAWDGQETITVRNIPGRGWVHSCTRCSSPGARPGTTTPQPRRSGRRMEREW